MGIPLSAPDITQVEVDAVTAVLRTRSLSLGPKLPEFEAALAGYCGVAEAVAVSSGTAALHLAVRALGIGPGDEVIVPSFTFVAVANAVRFEGATPVFADMRAGSWNVDPASVEAAITAQTRALIVVHTFGEPAPMDELMELARRHGLKVIEDACEAVGGSYRGRKLGSFGDVAVLAFYPNKQMTTGEGGAALTSDPALATRMRALRNQGRYPGDDWLQHAELGYNYRLPEMACALGLAQLGRLDGMLARRAQVARRYDGLLEGIAGIERPALTADAGQMSWFVYVVRLTGGLRDGARDRVLERLRREGIGCGRYFAPVHLQPAYAVLESARRRPLPVTEAVAQTTLALPFFNALTEAEAGAVAEALKRAVELEGPE